MENEEEKIVRFYTIISDDYLHGIETALNRFDLEYDELQVHGNPFRGEHNEWCLLISYR